MRHKKEFKNFEKIEVRVYSKEGMCYTYGFNAPVLIRFKDKTKQRTIMHKGRLGGTWYTVSSRLYLTLNIVGDSAKNYVVITNERFRPKTIRKPS